MGHLSSDRKAVRGRPENSELGFIPLAALPPGTRGF